MARTTIVELVDDLDGGPADETVTFSLDGVSYEIDLSADNAGKLRAALAPFTAAARRPKPERPAKGETASRGADTRERSAAIRAWAKQHGIEVNDRGRIPSQVTNAYNAGDPSLAKPSRDIPQVTFQAG